VSGGTIGVDNLVVQFGDDPPSRFSVGGGSEFFDHGRSIAVNQRSLFPASFQPSEKHLSRPHPYSMQGFSHEFSLAREQNRAA
jgi:hypothetical protein